MAIQGLVSLLGPVAAAVVASLMEVVAVASLFLLEAVVVEAATVEIRVLSRWAQPVTAASVSVKDKDKPAEEVDTDLQVQQLRQVEAPVADHPEAVMGQVEALVAHHRQVRARARPSKTRVTPGRALAAEAGRAPVAAAAEARAAARPIAARRVAVRAVRPAKAAREVAALPKVPSVAMDRPRDGLAVGKAVPPLAKALRVRKAKHKFKGKRKGRLSRRVKTESPCRASFRRTPK